MVLSFYFDSCLTFPCSRVVHLMVAFRWYGEHGLGICGDVKDIFNVDGKWTICFFLIHILDMLLSVPESLFNPSHDPRETVYFSIK